MRHGINVDYTPRSTVVFCGCGWRDVCSTRAAALNAGARHLMAVDEIKAANSITQRRARLNGQR